MSVALAESMHDAGELVRRYAVQGPRYTSYPTALNFRDDFGVADYDAFLKEARRSPSPLSLYVHVPFCHSLCYYCACNKVITRDPNASRRYLDHLHKELEMLSDRLGPGRRVTQLHLGGGTPNYLDKAEMTELVHSLATHFNLDDGSEREFSIELDPRSVDEDYLALLKGLGFNRISMGIQDTDLRVQEAINRVQSTDMIARLMGAARRYNFRSVSMDLIYGLPRQTLETFSRTLDDVIALSPERIALYHYAHLPQRFKWQKSMDRHPMPNSEEKLSIFLLAEQRLSEAGYINIGMDHFVKPEDELAKFQQEGRLQRNFHGYSTCRSPDVIGMGVSAISSLGRCYAQNHKSLEEYYAAIDAGQLPVAKGLTLNAEDLLRRYVIMQLACNLRLSYVDLYDRFHVFFRRKFADAIPELEAMEREGIVTLMPDELRINDRGRLLLRNICMLFDQSLEQHQGAYSKTL